MPRFTQPEADRAILLHKLKLDLPQQPPPRIKTRVPEFPQEALQPYCERQVSAAVVVMKIKHLLALFGSFRLCLQSIALFFVLPSTMVLVVDCGFRVDEAVLCSYSCCNCSSKNVSR